jgi:hypothetical protein
MRKCVFAFTVSLALLLPLSASAGEKNWKDATHRVRAWPLKALSPLCNKFPTL